MSSGYDPERLRSGLHTVPLKRVFRVIHRNHHAALLSAVPTPSRFSDPQGRYAVLYAAESVRCAFWETLGRNRFVRRQRREMPRFEVDSQLVVSICSDGPLSLGDLRDDGPVRIGAPSAVAENSNHAAGRALSVAVHDYLPEAVGFLYASRFTGEQCVAVFDRAFYRLRADRGVELARNAKFLDTLDEYDIVLTEPPT